MASRSSATLALTAYERLRRDVTNGVLAPGAKLRVAELHDHYQIGLSPLREALSRLCSDGLVVKRERQGFYVSELDEKEFMQITNTRLVLEETALRLSFANGGARWEEAILLAFHRLSKAGEGSGDDYMLQPDWARFHQEFHTALLSACDNEWLLRFSARLYEQSARYRLLRRLRSAGHTSLRPDLVKEHRDILDACLSGNIDAAVDLLIEHYKKSMEIVLGVSVKVLKNPTQFVVDDVKPSAPHVTEELQSLSSASNKGNAMAAATGRRRGSPQR
jgi:GntR family transcriptional regulator, carbon starvation induced regulator